MSPTVASFPVAKDERLECRIHRAINVRRFPLSIVVALLIAAMGGNLLAGPVAKGFKVQSDSISPDQRLGVTVPILSQAPENAKNTVIVVETGKALGVIKGETGWNRQNNGGVAPARWSKDSSVLVWMVDGKWFPAALVVLKCGPRAVLWQVDLLRAVQDEMLARTKAAQPKKYAAIVTGHKGWGSAYREGFSIDVDVDGEIAFPLHFHGALSSDPKGADDLPKLESNLEGSIDEKGKVTVTRFALGPGKSENF